MLIFLSYKETYSPFYVVILITSYYLFNDLNVNTQSFSITFEVNDNFIESALSIYKYNDVNKDLIKYYFFTLSLSLLLLLNKLIGYNSNTSLESKFIYIFIYILNNIYENYQLMI